MQHIQIVASPTELETQLTELSRPTAPTLLAFVNAHAMNTVAEDPAFFDALARADVLYRDGIGMEWMYRTHGRPAGLNLNGTDLIPRLLARFDGRVIALYGTQEPYLERAATRIAADIAPQSILHNANGFLQADAYVSLARAQRPSLIVLGMGMPKQEQVAAQLRARLDFACLIVCGGAIIDFLGGKVSRAPAWMRANGLEWVYRLALEPKRLFKRYVMGNPKFLARVLLQAGVNENRN